MNIVNIIIAIFYRKIIIVMLRPNSSSSSSNPCARKATMIAPMHAPTKPETGIPAAQDKTI
jgi:hypothetical protein